ncbi:acyclic terpene utilization AtuA family protein [Pseudonocardia sp. NPDC049154]|uniref:acyclic terpene utilization AtuA family protein n=1 Tax=Pseudonocardia sp. NPDC049154 TaxID=3155501 RepID=UPI0033E4F61E
MGQFSAYHGDRPDGMGELLDSGVDVLTGDYLAELTMLVLRKNQLRGGQGYAAAFVEQLERYLPRIAEGGVKVVTNAGGLDPEGCATAVREACARAGVDLGVAAVTGDDLREDLGALLGADATLRNVDTGDDLVLADHEILTANAYLGAWPIVAALQAGADIVVCPRMTDASLIVGPAAWRFGWARDDWDRLAGGVVAGHLIECCGQVTGGNFALFDEYPDLGLPGMPIAVIAEDGGCVVTKAAGTGGVVDTNTVTAQLLYEVGGREYLNPDVTVDLASIHIADAGTDRVAVFGTRGRAPNELTKLSLTYEGGYRNSITVGLTGRHVAEKLAWLQRAVERAVGAPEEFDAFRWTVVGPVAEVGGDQSQASAWVVITARDADRAKVGRKGFADRIVQLGTNNVPGFYLTTPPQKERLYGVQWPCLVEKKHIQPRVVVDGEVLEVAWEGWEPGTPPEPVAVSLPAVPTGATVEVPLGELVGTRSGDKGGVANLGVWARTPEVHAWLRSELTAERLAELVPEADGLRIVRHELPNLAALNFLLIGYLEEGVSSCTRIDPQAKGLGEYLASKVVEVPAALVPSRA